ncbi:2-hydroxyacid dehydrogenase [Pseudopelagicola sp. nBUS_20]|uniref:2-hydroxyacid dehydrogenase n=1 Tax=Pseudopelagicola sp. nBUS_20 TaxID=3395317 RepID=UPI003EB9C916
MINVLFAANSDGWETYSKTLRAACSEVGLAVDLRVDHAPERVDYIVYAPDSHVKDFRPFTQCKAVLNLWAGVENVVNNKTLTKPLVRMVDPGMTQGMTEWVTGHTMRHHLGMDKHILGQDGEWRSDIPPLSRDRHVTILGLGQLGMACARAISYLGFSVTGWSRSQKKMDSVACLHGKDGLKQALTGAEILVLLLPKTPATENILNANSLAQLPAGACIINPGRGHLIDDTALLSALDADHIAHATLDVFRTEPLSADHPFWAHPKITVTPHIASATRAETASRVIAKNIQRGEAGEAFLYLVDRQAGY